MPPNSAPAAAKPQAPRLAADIAKPLQLSEPAKLLLAPGLQVRQYFEALLAKKELIEDAIRFLAAALPKRESVWWGLCCVKESFKPPLPEPSVKALVAVEAWVRAPNETNRRAASAAAEPIGCGTAPGCLASAAAWSSGSMAPPRQPVVPPPEHLTAITVAAALAMAAVVDPLKAEAARARFLLLGQQVAAGQLKW